MSERWIIVCYFLSLFIFCFNSVLSRSLDHLTFNNLIRDNSQMDYVNFTNSISTGRSRKLPKAIIIGAKKSGTRALLEFLRIHPDIVAPGPEVHFFDKNYEKGYDWYRNQMPLSYDHQLTAEKSPRYFIQENVPERIHKMSSKLKLMLVVRDPVTRAISDYVQGQGKQTEYTSFKNLLFNNKTGAINTNWSAIQVGLYSKHLQNWLKYFPLSQIHIISMESLVTKPAEVMSGVEKFLGLRPVITSNNFMYNSTKGFFCIIKDTKNAQPHCLKETKGRQHPQLDFQIHQRLSKFFQPYNKKFYQLTNIDFGWQ